MPNNDKKKKKKKMAVSFSEEMNETRTFERIDEKEVSKVWYSQEEANEQRVDARYETRDVARIGLVDGGTQTSPMVEYGTTRSGRSRREEVAQMRGRVTRGRQHWRKGQQVNTIELHKQVDMPNDPVFKEIRKRGYKDDGTGRYRR